MTRRRDRPSISAARGRQLMFAGLVTTIMLASVSQNALSAALPTIIGDLHGVHYMGWVVTSFMLAATVSMPVYGRLSDQVGRRVLLLFGTAVFMVGSVAGGFAPTLGWLIAARVVQGLGAGAIIVLAQATVADLVPARERPRVLARMNSVFTLAWVVGPLVGGGLTEGPGWRWVFWVNLPVGLAALALLFRYLHLPSPVAERTRLDVGGIVLLSASTSALLVLCASVGAGYTVPPAAIAVMIAVLTLGTAAFIVVQRSTAHPVMPPKLFRDRNFVLTTLTSLLTGAVMMAVISYLPTYLQMVTTVDATSAGLWMLPVIAGILVTSNAGGSFVTRTGRYRMLPVVGLGIVAVDLVVLSVMPVDASLPQLGLVLGVLGAGLGLAMNLLVLIGQNSFGHAMVGTATSTTNFFRQIGSAVGVAIVGGLFSNRLAQALAATGTSSASLTPEEVHALPESRRLEVVHAYHDALLPIYGYVAPLALIAVVLMACIEEKPFGPRARPSGSSMAETA